MIYIQTDGENKVNFIHYMPFDNTNGLGKTEEELRKEGYLIEKILEPQQIENKYPTMHYTEEKGIYYEYEDIPKSKEKLQELQEKNINSLVQTVAKLNLENKKKDSIATTLAQTVASLNLRINKLEKLQKEGE